MFDALVNGRIDTRGIEFKTDFFDIEQLNRKVLDATNSADDAYVNRYAFRYANRYASPVRMRTADAPDISKISYAVLPLITDRYSLLDSGSALGFGNGPLLVAQADFARTFEKTRHFPTPVRIAIPGVHTTANLLLDKLFPEFTDKRPVLFSDIAPAIARGDFDAGVLIHEGRFTYRDHGLELASDLGAEWERATGGLPLPLGAIVVSKRLPADVVKTVEELVRESVRWAMEHPEDSREFVRAHARELSGEVIRSHIELFVNRFSLSLGTHGRAAVKKLTGV